MPGTALYQRCRKEIIDHDPGKYNFFNCVMKTKLPVEEFYRRIGSLWMIKKGSDVL
jgi:hypothetical protein